MSKVLMSKTKNFVTCRRLCPYRLMEIYCAILSLPEGTQLLSSNPKCVKKSRSYRGFSPGMSSLIQTDLMLTVAISFLDLLSLLVGLQEENFWFL